MSGNLSGCPTHIADNRLDLEMTDAPDLADVLVSSPRGTSDNCFVSCVIRVEQSVCKSAIRVCES